MNDTVEGRLNLKVEGMTCNHCASTVSGIIKQEGGADVHVDYLMGEAHFDLGNPDRLAVILKRLNAAGYASSADNASASQTGMSSIEKKFLLTLPFSLILFSHMFVPHDWWINLSWVQLLLCLPVFLIGSLHFGKSTYESIKSGHLNMDVLILLGSSSAFVYSVYGVWAHAGDAEAHRFLFFETTSTIITLVLLGYVIEHRAVQRTTTILRDLFKAAPDKAKKLVQKGLNQDLEVVDANSLQRDDIILINTGDRVPADGTIIFGTVSVDEAMLTGEAQSVQKTQHSRVLGGSVVSDGSATLKVERAGRESTMGQIVELVKQSRSDKPAVQRLADRISAVFVPTILGISVLTFGLNYLAFDVYFSESLLRSIAVLVIACPCAMGLATPTAVSVGLGLAAKLGIIVKRASVFEEVSALNKLVFDKTGTLTSGQLEFVLEEVIGDHALEKIWGLIRALEMRSNHPLAKSILPLTAGVAEIQLEAVREVSGAGMEGQFEGSVIRFGTPEFACSDELTADLVLSVDGKPTALFRVKDQLKPDAAATIDYLRQRGLNLAILSGDREAKTAEVARALNIADFHSRQLPDQKLKAIESWKKSHIVGMVGDGINDSPSLSKADLGISIGNTNALAAESAKVVILGSKLELLKQLFRISTSVVKAIKQNLVWAFAYNVVAIPLAAAGYLDPMLAALSMAFSDVIVIGNSLRLRYLLPKQIV
jgi:Cu+-exporting ATPase